MAPVTLNWSTAEVKSSKLTVPLEGDIPKGWRRSFEATVQLLGGGEWGEIQVKRDKVQVNEVEPGSEDKLRHHLESVVTQANADHEPDQPGGSEEDEAPDAEGSEPEADDEDDGADAEMTRRFQSF